MDHQNDNPPLSYQALELVMRDVLDGLLEMSLAVGFAPGHDGGFEILEIAPEQPAAATPNVRSEREENENAAILDFPLLKVAG
jgi:hypothetical protein